MHAAPPLQVEVIRPVALRAAVWLLVVMVCVAMMSWSLAHSAPVPTWVSATSVGGTLFALRLGRQHPCHGSLTLRWDGQYWHVGQVEAVEPVSGEVVVAIDLGSLILLRFTPNTVSRWRYATWIAVTRRGLETHWHALRCALYSPRPSQAVPFSA